MFILPAAGSAAQSPEWPAAGSPAIARFLAAWPAAAAGAWLDGLDAAMSPLLVDPRPERLDEPARFLDAAARAGLGYPGSLRLLEAYEEVFREALARRACPAEARYLRQLLAGSCHFVKARLQLLRRLKDEPVRALVWHTGQGDLPSQAHGWCDGSLKPGRAGIGYVLRAALDGALIAQGYSACEARTALEAELCALVALLKLAHSQGVRSLTAYTDAEGAVRALQKGTAFSRYGTLGRELASVTPKFTALSVHKIPRVFNHVADRLAARQTE